MLSILYSATMATQLGSIVIIAQSLSDVPRLISIDHYSILGDWPIPEKLDQQMLVSTAFDISREADNLPLC